MPNKVWNEVPDSAAEQLHRIEKLLGGISVLGRKLHGPLDAHEMLLEGLPGKVSNALADRLVVVRGARLEKAIGMSLRTLQRRKENPAKRLSPEQSGRIWKFAEILARATAVLGSLDAAEEWLDRPAIGLNQRRPIDLLSTPAGVELVEELLGRIEHGVYV
jgi:putative toxin-antitoxin system antitoxin component (TIGR02293 family)